LLLDEPTTGLDPQARHLVWDRLFRLKQRGATLVLTTHYMDEAEQLCDRLVVMDKGKIVAEGSPLELIRRYSTREVVELRFRAGRRMTAASLAFRSYEFWLAYYRRVWRGSVVSSIVNPVFYLAALGVGLGTLVNKSSAPPGGVTYAHFVAPGLLAAAAMQIGTTESTWPVLGSVKWTRSYF